MVKVLRLPSDQVLTDLFEQAIIGRKKGDPYIDGLREFAGLLKLEFQNQLLDHPVPMSKAARERNRQARLRRLWPEAPLIEKPAD